MPKSNLKFNAVFSYGGRTALFTVSGSSVYIALVNGLKAASSHFGTIEGIEPVSMKNAITNENIKIK